MIMANMGIWQPTPEKVPDEFAQWLHREYGGSIALAWNKRDGRWAIFAISERTKKPALLTMLETDEGFFVPLNDGAKRMIKERVLHASQVHNDDARVDREVREFEAKAKQRDVQFIRDVITDPVNARRMIGNSSRKGPGATARKAIEDRKKRGE